MSSLDSHQVHMLTDKAGPLRQASKDRIQKKMWHATNERVLGIWPQCNVILNGAAEETICAAWGTPE